MSKIFALLVAKFYDFYDFILFVIYYLLFVFLFLLLRSLHPDVYYWDYF